MRFAHAVKQESNLVRELAILAIDVSEKLAPMLPKLRRPAGVAVAAIVRGKPSPSDEFAPGDLICAVNGEPVVTTAGLRGILSKLKSGDAVVVQVQRQDQLMLIAFELP